MTREELIELMARATEPDFFRWFDEDPENDEWQSLTDCMRQGAARSLDALSAAGFAIVPRNPTPEMERALLSMKENVRPEVMLAGYEALVEAALTGEPKC